MPMRFLLVPLFVIIAVFLPPAESFGEETIVLELNKTEAAGEGCRVYMLFANRTSGAIESYKPDLVFFNTDSVIADRLVVEGGPLPAGKTRVKLFDVANIGCPEMQRVLLNDVRTCAGSKPSICLEQTRTSSRNAVEFIK